MKSHRDNSEKYISRDGNLITIMKGFAKIDSVFDKLLESGQKKYQDDTVENSERSYSLHYKGSPERNQKYFRKRQILRVDSG